MTHLHSKQPWWSSLMPGQNVRCPHHMHIWWVSEYADGTDIQGEGWTTDCYIMLSTRRDQHKKNIQKYAAYHHTLETINNRMLIKPPSNLLVRKLPAIMLP